MADHDQLLGYLTTIRDRALAEGEEMLASVDNPTVWNRSQLNHTIREAQVAQERLETITRACSAAPVPEEAK